MTTKMKTHTLKWRQKRVRTWSSDSGCEVGLMDHDDIADIVDDTNRVWTDMVNMYVQQKFNEAKDELINTFEGNKTTRLEECRKNIFKVLTQLPDIVKNVNKEVETIVKCQVDQMMGSCSIDLIDEKEEAHELIESSKKRKADVQIQQRYTKLRRWSDHIAEDDLEDLDNEFDALLSDWDWSDSEEWDWENDEDKIPEKSTNNNLKLLENFYDDLEIDPSWNDFNYWKMDLEYENLEDEFMRKYLKISIRNEDLIAHDDPDAHDLLIECSPDNTDWTNWKFWNNFGSVKEILEAYENICDNGTVENKIKASQTKKSANKMKGQNFKVKRWQKIEHKHLKKSIVCQKVEKMIPSKRKLLMKIHPKQPKKQMKFSSFCDSA